MSHYYAIPLVSEPELDEVRHHLGPGLARILGYFRDDGARAIIAIEEALARRDATAMVRPAHTLKAEARQFGGLRLGDIAETIEKTARRCVEEHSEPAAVAVEVAMLRASFIETLTVLDKIAEHAMPPRPYNQRPGASPAQKLFGRRLAS